MTKEDILRKYGESTNNSILIQELAGNATRVQLKNVIGSGASFIAATAYQHIHKTNLLILPDKEEAAYFLNDLWGAERPLSSSGTRKFYPLPSSQPLAL